MGKRIQTQRRPAHHPEWRIPAQDKPGRTATVVQRPQRRNEPRRARARIQAEVPKYGKYIEDFYMVRPGVTGMWQTSGRSDTTYDERVQMDTWYVRNWNVWFDIVLIWRTISVVLKHKGAY